MEDMLNEKIIKIKQHIISIRFPDGMSVVDVMMNEGWSLPKSDRVGFEPIPDQSNYYMLYPLIDDVNVNEILDYLDDAVKLNIEREVKFELLKTKVVELEAIFHKSTLKRCESLKFTFGEDNKKKSPINLKVNDIPLGAPDNVELIVSKPAKDNAPVKTINEVKVGNKVIDLPPKDEKIVLEEFEEPTIICKCGPNDMCPVCVDEKTA